MIADIGAVLWKELRVVLWDKGSLVRGLRSVVLALAIFGIVLPWQFGRELIDTPAALVVWIWVPCLMAVSVVADAFAGERERHTLETLLSMPLADAAIFIGKFAAAVLYGWAFTVIASLVAAGVVNVLHPDEAPIFYAPELFAGDPRVRPARDRPARLDRHPGVAPVADRSTGVADREHPGPGPGPHSRGAEPARSGRVDPGDPRRHRPVGPVATGIVVAVLLAAIDATIVIAGMGRFKRAQLIAVP